MPLRTEHATYSHGQLSPCTSSRRWIPSTHTRAPTHTDRTSGGWHRTRSILIEVAAETERLLPTVLG
jgi:hypothetical protein